VIEPVEAMCKPIVAMPEPTGFMAEPMDALLYAIVP
jgi:hypothetical protein